MGGAIILCARKAITQAPAVCELDGPIMLGPMTSKTLMNDMVCSSYTLFFYILSQSSRLLSKPALSLPVSFSHER